MARELDKCRVGSAAPRRSTTCAPSAPPDPDDRREQPRGRPGASATPVSYVVQIAGGGSTAYWHPKLSLDGDALTTFSMQAVPQQCAGGTPSAISSDESFDIALSAPVQLSGGAFSFQVQAPAGNYPGSWSGQATVSGNVASGVSGLARPSPPPPPGPEAFLQWAAVRVPVGATYNYYFVILGVRCADGANQIKLGVAGRTTRVGCRSADAWASGPLAPGRTYTVSAQALRVVRGRIRKRGQLIVEPLQMPAAGDSGRQPWTGSLGPPPG